MRDQIDKARRVIADHLVDPSMRDRLERRLATWNEPTDDFLDTAGVVLALALYQAQRKASGEPGLGARPSLWGEVTEILAADAAPEDLFVSLPTDLDPDSQRQIQSLRLMSVGISPAMGIRWLRLLQTARAVAGRQS